MDLCWDLRWEEHGWERLAPGVGRRRLPGWDATAGLVVGEDSVLLYDTGATLHEGAGLRAGVRSLLGERRVTHVALSHPHFDHVLGTAVFSGVEVYGAVGLARLLSGGGPGLYEEAVRLGADAGETARAVEVLVVPRHEVSGELVLELGGGRRAVLVNVGPGHTAHDLAVLVPGASAGVGAGGKFGTGGCGFGGGGGGFGSGGCGCGLGGGGGGFGAGCGDFGGSSCGLLRRSGGGVG
ncbi:MBL fold metallo-hydrolase [Streptomyces sp. GMY02]|uniref:MBL fold metallo-hydrolase n=1 Tax=Streptomyces sp. GMY02 TaxID=1333528 RepID=UPI001C2C7394|nr:MBL fold metallo-hydrolase [Streptomyces sp. GMY02]QXE36885.1 MBL fold metallo-hydrolase [Streptomyces sp. GMY02]